MFITTVFLRSRSRHVIGVHLIPVESLTLRHEVLDQHLPFLPEAGKPLASTGCILRTRFNFEHAVHCWGCHCAGCGGSGPTGATAPL